MNIRDIIFLENCLSELNKSFTADFVIVHSWCSTVGIFAFFCLSRVVWFVGAIWTPELTHIYKLVYISRYFFDPGCGCKIIKEWMTAFSPKWVSYSAKIFRLLYTIQTWKWSALTMSCNILESQNTCTTIEEYLILVPLHMEVILS